MVKKKSYVKLLLEFVGGVNTLFLLFWSFFFINYQKNILLIIITTLQSILKKNKCKDNFLNILFNVN